jgi:hypothetical protein
VLLVVRVLSVLVVVVFLQQPPPTRRSCFRQPGGHRLHHVVWQLSDDLRRWQLALRECE